MTPNLEQAKALILSGSTYPVAAKVSGFGHPAALHDALKNDPDIVAAKEAGLVKSRRGALKSSDHYAAKPYVQAVLNGMTHTEAAACFGVSQPLVSRHVKLAGAAARVGRPTPPTTPPSPDAVLIAEMAKSLAAKGSLTPRQLLEAASQLLTA